MATTYEKDGTRLVESTTKTVVEEASYTLAEIDNAIAGLNDQLASVEANKAVWVARKDKAEELEVEEVALVADVPQTPLPVDAEPQPV